MSQDGIVAYITDGMMVMPLERLERRKREKVREREEEGEKERKKERKKERRRERKKVREWEEEGEYESRVSELRGSKGGITLHPEAVMKESEISLKKYSFYKL
jgi:hypothetical protein